MYQTSIPSPWSYFPQCLTRCFDEAYQWGKTGLFFTLAPKQMVFRGLLSLKMDLSNTSSCICLEVVSLSQTLSKLSFSSSLSVSILTLHSSQEVKSLGVFFGHPFSCLACNTALAEVCCFSLKTVLESVLSYLMQPKCLFQLSVPCWLL